jgi:tryptophanyl-tRNA synthetase
LGGRLYLSVRAVWEDAQTRLEPAAGQQAWFSVRGLVIVQVLFEHVRIVVMSSEIMKKASHSVTSRETPEPKPRIFSGIQPSGTLHVGNYLGAIKHWVERQKACDNVFCIVDMHALTIPESVDPESLKEKVRQVAALYLAAGIDPSQSTIFVQSHVPEHAQLQWILTCVTPLGWLERMTQFKSKAKGRESVGTGLLVYPVLQAADILLYDARLVPVGEDQRQHIELAREVAQRFNRLFGDTLVPPEPLIPGSGARVMGLDDPTAKMSKSVAATKRGHAIGLLDSPDEIRRSISRATTDSQSSVDFAALSPGTANLLELYAAFSGASSDQVKEEFEGQRYSKLKTRVADTVIEALSPLQERYAAIAENPELLDAVLDEGADKAAVMAGTTMKRVEKAVGFTALHAE